MGGFELIFLGKRGTVCCNDIAVFRHIGLYYGTSDAFLYGWRDQEDVCHAAHGRYAIVCDRVDHSVCGDIRLVPGQYVAGLGGICRQFRRVLCGKFYPYAVEGADAEPQDGGSAAAIEGAGKR